MWMKPKFLEIVLFLLMVVGIGFLFPFKVADAKEVVEKPCEMTVFENAPFVLEGYTYIPVREIAEHLGVAVTWNGSKNQLILDDCKTGFSFKPLTEEPGWGEYSVLSHGSEQTGLKDEAEVISWPYHMEEGRYFLPLRYLAQTFGWSLVWNPGRREASLSVKGANGRVEAMQFYVEDPYARRLWPTPKRIAYLTFDDGPSQAVTPLILDILNQENIKATFFVVGEQAKRNPEILERIHKEGHTIGNHTYSHQPAVLLSGVEPFMQEIRQAEEVIHSVIGERPRIVRMPYGTNFSNWPAYNLALQKSGYRHVSWNINSFDANAKNVPAEQIINAVKQQVAGKDKVIILFHDLASKTTVIALPEIIHHLKSQGYFIWPMSN